MLLFYLISISNDRNNQIAMYLPSPLLTLYKAHPPVVKCTKAVCLCVETTFFTQVFTINQSALNFHAI